MTTRTHHTPSPKAAKSAKAPSTPAARTMKVDAAKAADQAEQEKLARAKQLESAKPEAGTEAAAEGQTMADASGIGALEGAGAVSPLAIGAGVLGVAAIAAATDSGGGGSNNSSANTPAPIGQNPHGGNSQPGASTDRTDTTPKPGGSEKPQGGGTQGGNGTQGGEEPQTGEKPQTPPRYAQAEAKGTPDKPLVSIEGETRLTQADDFFKAKLAEAGHSEASPKFIRIGRVQASNDPADPDARVVRFPEESDAQASHTRTVALKAPEAAAAGPELTAYEVIKSDKPLTYEEARAAAEKLGGKLLVVDNEAEAQWLNEHFLSRLGENGDPANLATNGAWIGSNKLPGKEQTTAAIRNPGEKLTEAHYYTPAEGQTFKTFVIEFANYKTPLTLNGKPVLDGSVIDAADFDKLVWNGDFNQSGSIEFSVVDSRDAKQAGTIKDTMVLQESAEVIRRELPADNGTDHQPDNTQPGNDQPGSDAGQPGANAGNGGKDNSGSNSNESDSQGQNGQSGPGAGTGTPGASPNVKLPNYPEDGQQTAKVTLNKTDATLDKALFLGSGEGNTPPAFIRIVSIEVMGHNQGTSAPSVLKLHTGLATDPVKQIQIGEDIDITLASNWFNSIQWDASHGNGGTITFLPAMDEKGTPIRHAQPQSITITETPATPTPPASNGPGSDTPSGQDPAVPGQQPKPAAPEYDQDSLRINVEENQTYTFSKDFFDGKQNDVTHVKIEAVKNGTDGSPAAEANTLKLGNEDISSTPKVITVEQAATLVWDASKAQGGSFQFTPVNAQGVTLPNAKVQTVTITETPALVKPTAPTYAPGNEHTTPAISHNSEDFNFASMQAAFEGTDGTHKATHVKITEIRKNSSEPADENTLTYEGKNVTEGMTIEVAKLSKLVWNASLAEDGSFKFTAVQNDGAAFSPAAPTQTVTINEEDASPVAPTPPSYGDSNAHTAEVGYNQTDFNFTSIQSAFEGTDNEHKATHVKITEIRNGNGNEAVEGTLTYNSNKITPTTLVPVSDLENLVWDASKAQGGSFKFTAVQDNGSDFSNPPAAQTVTINEAEYEPESGSKQVNENVVTRLGADLFHGSVDGSNDPAFIKITKISSNPDELKLNGTRLVYESGGKKTAYQVVTDADGIELETARDLAALMGGSLLKIDNTDEAAWISKKLSSKLNLGSPSTTEGVTQGAWMEPADPSVTDAAGKEGILSSDGSQTTYVDLGDSHTKMNAYVIEISNYNEEAPGLVLEGETSSARTPVTVGDPSAIIPRDKIPSLAWNAIFNNGGSIKFIEVTSQAGDQNVEGAKEKTINITEKDPVALATRSLSTSLPDVSNLLADDQPSLPGI